MLQLFSLQQHGLSPSVRSSVPSCCSVGVLHLESCLLTGAEPVNQIEHYIQILVPSCQAISTVTGVCVLKVNEEKTSTNQLVLY